jgi:ribosome maturation protein SDO1
MVNIDKAVLARLTTHGAKFEVLVDCNLAIAFKEGKNVDMKELLAAQEVYIDSKKGLKASDVQLEQIFGTNDPVEAAKQIIKKGEVQLTAEYRQGIKEQKRKQIVTMIHRNAVDPKSHLPHPPQRIELAMEQAKVHVDEFKPVDQQVLDVLNKIRPILPIKFEMKELTVKIPAKYAGSSQGILRSFGKILKESWQNDGSWLGVVEIPGGLEQDFYDKINPITHGEAEVTVSKIK